MDVYEVSMSMYLLSFEIMASVSQLPYVWYYVRVKSSFQCEIRHRGDICR